MISIINLGAACCIIECEGIRILCDPWLFGRIYLGTWEREIPLADPIASIGHVDYIWISHCHDDHYHPPSIRAVMEANPGARLWIGPSPYLGKIMARDGFAPIIQDRLRFGEDFMAEVIPNQGYDIDINIDTALVVIDKESALINMNDCPYDQRQVDRINSLTLGKHITALLPYSGAGPWPQCYKMSEVMMHFEAKQKKKKFLELFERYRVALRAQVAHPFSAGYSLCGYLMDLNEFRGIPLQSEVPNAIPLPVHGINWVTIDYAWQNDPMPEDQAIHKLILMASHRAPKVTGDPLTIDIHWGECGSFVDATHASAAAPHETIIVDPRLLHGLLTRKYHWNTAEIGSCLQIERHGKIFDPRVFQYLYKFHI